MLEQIFGSAVANSNVFGYSVFLAIVVLAFIAAKLSYWIFSKIFLAITSKTKTRLDDLMVDALRGPVIFVVLVVGLHYGSVFLNLSESGKEIYSQFISVCVTLIVAWFIMRIINAVLKNYIQPLTKKSKNKFDDTIFPVIRSLVNFSIIFITIILILQNLGYEVTSLVAGLGIGGLAFALAAKDVLGNMFGGAAIIADKPFKVGDRVKVDGQDGQVDKITLRSTTLKTFGGTTVVMPNQRIVDSTLENVSSEKMRRIKMVLGLTYATTPKKLELAKKIVTEIILRHKEVDDNLIVSFSDFSASSLDILVIYYIKDLTNILTIKDQINMEIKKRFDKEKLDFAFPTQTIHLKK